MPSSRTSLAHYRLWEHANRDFLVADHSCSLLRATVAPQRATYRPRGACAFTLRSMPIAARWSAVVSSMLLSPRWSRWRLVCLR